jgi:hypothetical protein
MKSKLIRLFYEVELETGEKMSLPETLVNSINAGRWLITIEPLTNETKSSSIRSHHAFLNGYAPEDEGLYDDY